MTKNQTLHLSKIIIINDGEPIFNGGLLVEDSKIVKAGKKEDFGDSFFRENIIDHGESLICPGFINLHTHLLYSNVKKINGDEGLFSWLEKLAYITANWSEKDFISSINYGINEAISTGTTYLVENTPSLLSAQELSKSPLKALIGLEVFGSDEERADKIFSDAIEVLNRQSQVLNQKSKIENRKLDFSLSPHAPYDVSKSLWKNLIEWSNNNNKPLLTHLEESPHEKKWWQEKSGDGITFWKKIGKLDSKLKYWKKYNSGIDFLKKNDSLSKNIIATHLCQASREDLISLKEKNISLVHSPRSNFYLNNGTANLRLWNELGFLWGIGTDSIASNENLDLLEEARFTINQQNLIFNYKILAREIFHAITINAAKILNKDSEIGILKNGACADFNVYDIKGKSECTYNDPYHLLIWDLDNKKNLKEVWINGNKAWLREQILNKI